VKPCLCGDPAYGLSAHICCPYSESHGPLTEDMLYFNKSMSGCRITVEWLFKEMTTWQVGVPDRQAPTEVSVKPSGKTVQSGHTSVQHPFVFERDQPDLAIFRRLSAVAEGVPGS
ncbi:unnamed protein product, partial [Laminaria digitata]